MSRAAPTPSNSDAAVLHRGEPARRRWITLALICVAHFMLVLDVTVVNVALPAMSADLHLDREALTWVVTAYTLCFGGLMLLGGRVSDVYGARRILLIGLAIFSVASFASGLAQTGSALIAGRIAQGIGAALLSPAALALVATTFEGKERDRALGLWAALGGIGSAAGVLVGGALTSGPGWVWVFFVNVPVGVAVLIALPLTVSPSAPVAVRRSIDLPGALLVTGATAAFIYGLVKAGEGGWDGIATLVALAAAIVLYGVFTIVERAVQTPLVDLRLFTRRPVLAGAFLMLIATGLLIAFFFLGSLYLQRVLAYSAMKTGLVFLPVAVAIGVGAQLGGRFVGRTGGRPVAVGGLTLATIGSVLLTGLSGESNPVTALLPGFVIAAFGVGGVFVAATTTALGYVPAQKAGLASGIVNTFHEVGGSVGVAVASTIAAVGINAGTVSGFSDAFTVAAVAAAAAAILAFFLIPAAKPQLHHAPQAG